MNVFHYYLLENESDLNLKIVLNKKRLAIPKIPGLSSESSECCETVPSISKKESKQVPSKIMKKKVI